LCSPLAGALGLLEAADTLGWMEATSTSHALEAHALGAAPPPALRAGYFIF